MKSFRMPSIGAANICTAFLLLLFYLLKQQRSGRILLMRLCFHSLLISCSVTTAFGTLSCIKKRRFSANVLPSHSLRRRNYQVIDHHTGSHREGARFYLFVTTVRCCTVPDFETEAVNVNSSPASSLMIPTDLPLISPSSEECQRALVNVGSTILPTLFKDALKASAIFGFKIESRFS